jgi:hypothetical protein
MKYEYGALVEWYGQGSSNFSDRNLSQYNFACQKFHTDWSAIEPAPSQWELVIQDYVECEVQTEVIILE